MLDIEIPGLDMVAVDLEPSRRRVRRDEVLPPALPDVASIGVPVVVPVDEDVASSDAVLRSFLREQASVWRFVLVHLACTFSTPSDGAITEAWLDVALGEDAGPTDLIAIVWSAVPERLSHVSEQSRSLKLGANLLLETSLELGGTKEVDEVHVQMYGLQESVCSWELNVTSRADIRGSYRFALIARTPATATVSGHVSMRCKVRRRRYGLFPYEAAVEGLRSLNFRL